MILKDLTDGHPQRRGCRACFLSGDDDCSLIEFGQCYPCTACEDGDQDCELIIPPKLKKSCLGCKRRKQKCSYRLDGGKGIDVCQECDDLDEPCCAAPLNENSGYAKRFDLRGSQREKGLEVAESPTKASTVLHKRSKNITKNFNSAGRSHRRADASGIGKKAKISSPVSRKVQNPRDSAKHGNNLKQSERRASSSLVGPPVRLVDEIQHRIIATCFAHPITFNHNPPDIIDDPCSWCSSSLFGLFGLGMTTVEVIPYDGSRGNIEVGGKGHHKSGKFETTKMCVNCTFGKVRIMTCKPHQLRPMTDIDKRSFDAGELNRSLQALNMGDSGTGELASSTQWCSICTSVAHFRCCKTQSFSPSAVPNPDQACQTPASEFVGCGLNLCNICHWTLERIERSKKKCKSNVIDRLIKARKVELWRWKGDELRADCEFLMENGEMMTRLREIDAKSA